MSGAGKPAVTGRWRMLRSDHAHTYAAEGAVMVATLLVYRLAAGLGGEDLDAYILVRRTLSFVQPMLMLGLAVGLPRLVAMTAEGPQRRRYLLAALRITLVLSLTAVVLASLFPAVLSRVVLGNAELQPVVVPLALMVLGLCLHTVAYSYIRGAHRTLQANILQVIGLALVPVLAFVFSKDLITVLLITGGGWSLAALLFMLPELLAAPLQLARTERGALLRYGLPRIPGDLAYAALFTVPVLWAAHRSGLAESGQIGLGVTLLNLVAAGFAPVSILLLPQAARAISTGDHHGLEQRIARLERWTLLMALIALVAVEGTLPWLLDIYLGDVPVAPYLPASRLIFLAAPALAYFVALRSVLDAYHTSPRNGVNIMLAMLVALATLVLVQLLDLAGPWPGLAVLTGLVYLAFRTRRDIGQVRSELRRKVQEGHRLVRLMVVDPGVHVSTAPTPSARRAEGSATMSDAVMELFALNGRASLVDRWRERRRFKERLRALRPDVVHARSGGITGLFAVLVSPVPVVITFDVEDLGTAPAAGRGRSWLRRLRSQVAAFFAAGIICRSERARELLWWRGEEAVIDDDSEASAAQVRQLLIRAAFHHSPPETKPS